MIRKAKREDLPECARVIRSAFRTVADEFGFTEENAPRFTAFATTTERLALHMEGEHRLMFVDEEDGRIRGYYSLLPKENGECELGSLSVLPEFRHRGIGGALLRHSVETARGLGFRVMNLSIVEENAALRQWYERHGAIHTGTRKFDFFPFTCGYMAIGLREADVRDPGTGNPCRADYSRKIAERQWNLPDKGELESRREATYIDDIIQKDHIERKLLEHLDGIRTVFDDGAGSGRFSILLAKKGCRVTHFDISQPMIDKARELAEREGVLDRITFVKGALEDLGAYPDRAFDLVISFDAPVSYTWPNQERVIGELVRIARKRIMLSVSSRLGSLPYLANPIQKNQFILDEDTGDPFARWCIANRKAMVDGFRFDRRSAEKLLGDGLMGGEEEIAEYERGGTPWCITYTFLPDELEGILARLHVKNIRLSGPGAYGRTVPREILVKIMGDPEQKADFLAFCYRYDNNPYVCGLGKDNLFATGEITGSGEKT